MIGFTCAESSYHSIENKCDNVFNPDDNFEWITKGEAKEAWIYLSFNEKIMITKILYRHSRKHISWNSNFNQHFKDILFEFSDKTNVNVTLKYPDVEDSGSERDIYFKIDPPLMTSSLKVKAISGYDLSMTDEKPQHWKNRYGISYIQIYGLQRKSKSTLFILYVLWFIMQYYQSLDQY